MRSIVRRADVLAGCTEGHVVMYLRDQYPQGALASVRILWQCTQPAERTVPLLPVAASGTSRGSTATPSQLAHRSENLHTDTADIEEQTPLEKCTAASSQTRELPPRPPDAPRKLWIWAHPACVQSLLEQLPRAFSLARLAKPSELDSASSKDSQNSQGTQPDDWLYFRDGDERSVCPGRESVNNPPIQTGGDSAEVRQVVVLSGRTEPAVLRDWSDWTDASAVSIRSLAGELNRFRLQGPRSPGILYSLLRPVRPVWPVRAQSLSARRAGRSDQTAAAAPATQTNQPIQPKQAAVSTAGPGDPGVLSDPALSVLQSIAADTRLPSHIDLQALCTHALQVSDLVICFPIFLLLLKSVSLLSLRTVIEISF